MPSIHNQPKRLLAIGDIHGHLDKLQLLMEQVKPTEQDRIVFLGDYIDRGPDSKGVIEFLIGSKKRFPKTIFLRGNHEQMLLDAIQESLQQTLLDTMEAGGQANNNEHYDEFLSNGGASTEKSYGCKIWDIPEAHVHFIEDCELCYCKTVEMPHRDHKTIEQEFIFVHAGLCPEVAFNNKIQDESDILWIRQPFLDLSWDWFGAIVVHGHTPDPEAPVFKEHRIGLDGGAAYLSLPATEAWGRLICCDALTREYWDQA